MKPEHDEPHSNFAFNLNLRRCIKGPCGYDPVSGSALGDPVTPASLSSSSSFSSLHSTTSGASILGNGLTPNQASRSNNGEETSASAPHTAGLGYTSSNIVSSDFDVMKDGSNVVSVEEFNWVADAVRTGAKNTDMWVKCYDNQEDTRSAPTFHFKCNNRGATITLVKMDGGHRVAAFAPLSWGGDSPWVTNSGEAALININTKKVARHIHQPW